MWNAAGEKPANIADLRLACGDSVWVGDLVLPATHGLVALGSPVRRELKFKRTEQNLLLERILLQAVLLLRHCCAVLRTNYLLRVPRTSAATEAIVRCLACLRDHDAPGAAHTARLALRHRASACDRSRRLFRRPWSVLVSHLAGRPRAPVLWRHDSCKDENAPLHPPAQSLLCWCGSMFADMVPEGRRGGMSLPSGLRGCDEGGCEMFLLTPALGLGDAVELRAGVQDVHRFASIAQTGKRYECCGHAAAFGTAHNADNMAFLLTVSRVVGRSNVDGKDNKMGVGLSFRLEGMGECLCPAPVDNAYSWGRVLQQMRGQVRPYKEGGDKQSTAPRST